MQSKNQKSQNISFGLVENEENTKRVLPKNSGYRLKFADQFEHLKNHNAVTVTSKGDKAWVWVNKGFEKMYNNISDECEDLEKQRQFDSFYYGLEFCDNKRNGVKPSNTTGGSNEDDWTSYDEAHWRR